MKPTSTILVSTTGTKIIMQNDIASFVFIFIVFSI
nr:MAG TPA: hypothetical protein [Caudoviricetes sp.]